MPGASPLVDDLDMVRRLEDAGAARSSCTRCSRSRSRGRTPASRWAPPAHAFAEGLSFLPQADPSRWGPRSTCATIARVKAAVSVPVIASLNGTTPGGWLRYAALLEQAGADALELNVYHALAERGRSGGAIEDGTVELVRDVKRASGSRSR